MIITGALFFKCNMEGNCPVVVYGKESFIVGASMEDGESVAKDMKLSSFGSNLSSLSLFTIAAFSLVPTRIETVPFLKFSLSFSSGQCVGLDLKYLTVSSSNILFGGGLADREEAEGGPEWEDV